MNDSLLVTKLQIPRQPPHMIQRARLIDALENGITLYKLILLSAPAGYGKTTQLGQWADASRFPVVWLSISQEENDLTIFFRYLLKGWEHVRPEIIESPLGLLLGARSPDSQAILSAFVNAANESPDHIVFVLDDYHLIKDESIHQAVTFLLDHSPPKLHFVLACRGEPPLPLSRYRARAEMLEFGISELRFLPEETQEFLNRTMGLDLTLEEIQPLQVQLEGWIAGLQLAALVKRREGNRTDPINVSGRQRFIADFLSQDILDTLPVDVRRFLLQTSILNSMCGTLCEAITGEEGGQEMLETLERENLFLISLDENREWFRYHRLFADFLRGELKKLYPDEIHALHRRAAGWYLGRDLPEQAFQHALDGQNVDLVIQIFERYIIVKLLGGEIKVVKHWLDSLPKAWYTNFPMIVFAQAGLLLVTGQFEAGARRLDDVEQLVFTTSEERDQHRARVTALRCNIACFQNDMARAESLAEKALQILPEEDLDFRAGIYGALGDTYRRNGRWEEAKKSYHKLLDLTHAPTFRVQAVHVYGALADLELRRGHLWAAADYWEKALGAIQQRKNWGSFPLPVIGWVYIRMGELYYEWNELDRSWDHLSKGIERAELGGDVRAMIAGYLVAARLKLTEGDLVRATDYLELARPHVESAQFSHWTGRYERMQLELWLAQDRLRTAVNWADAKLMDASFEKQPENEATQLAVSRVLIVKGDQESIRRAQAYLERLLHTSEKEGQMGIQIEALALKSLLDWKRGEQVGAMTALEYGLRLAEPEGYVRLFTDLGLLMARVLQEARSRKIMPDYVEILLSAFTGDIPTPVHAESVLPDPLTEREDDVLKLLAAGLSNREIAAELVVSQETAKKHAGSIYRKLGVHSRTEAAAKARELGLIS